ncbi:chemotaxis protein CheA [Pontixanthobacter sp.]|uniref:chemotaxis protein CheA n=1 Tax=Pontixanthobacter sp. TaxID=2792078 RepID=UPI003C7E5C79
MDDLLADFVAETREMLEAITGELVIWEQNPGERARLDAIFRFVHTVKGNCGFFDFPRLEALSHAAETALGDVRAGRRTADAAMVSAVLAIIDQIAVITSAIEVGQDMPAGSDDTLIAALDCTGSEPVPGPDAQSPAPSPPTKPPENISVTPRTIRLPVELLDRVMSGVSDMVLARNDLARGLRDTGGEPTLDGQFQRLSAILTDVRDAVTRMRMQRMEHVYNGLPRLVRDLSAELGKTVVIETEGGTVELDREMIEMIRDPITHLIRNAADHGIETPDQREAAGKSTTGRISIISRQSGNKIAIVLSDDGAGLDIDRIKEQALAAGLLSHSELNAMTDLAIGDLIFTAGLSTADSISGISGRGVGMDVVRSNIEKIGGTIEVRSVAGQGATFIMHLPLTLSIISALTVSTAGQTFAIPQSCIAEIANGKSPAIAFSQVGDADLVTIRGSRIPCLTLGNILGLTDRRAGHDQRLVMIRLSSGETFALAVDQIHDQEDLVVKPLAPTIVNAKIYGGSTLRDDGQPVLLLDALAIAKMHGLLSASQTRAVHSEDAMADQPAAATCTFMTFTDLHGRYRAIAIDLVTRIEHIAASAITVEGQSGCAVIDGHMLALAGIDGAPIPEGAIFLLHLSDGKSAIGYPVSKLGETIDAPHAFKPEDSDPMIAGLAVLDGKAVPVIDGYALFGRFGARGSPAGRPICSLPDDNEWARTILAPLISSAGYDVTLGREGAADVSIVIDEGDEDIADVPGTAIRLHFDINQAGNPDCGIYSYDRPALLAALRSIRLDMAL